MKAANRNKKKLGITTLLLLAACGTIYLGLQVYDGYLRNKIYTKEDTVNFSDFSIRLTKVEIKEVNFPLEQNKIAEYGPINQAENCETMSSVERRYQVMGVDYGPIFTDRQLCYQRKDSKEALVDYQKNNRQIVIDYAITAKNSIDASKVKISLMPDTGRNVNEVQLWGNDFIWYGEYNPFNKSGLDGNINKGIERKGYVYTDVRNNENSVDFEIRYEKNNQTDKRIIRITLD